MLYHAIPAGAVKKEVADVGGRVDVRGGLVDTVKGAQEGVVGMGHFGCNVNAAVGCGEGAGFGGGFDEGVGGICPGFGCHDFLFGWQTMYDS